MSKKGRVAQILMYPVDRMARRVTGHYRTTRRSKKKPGWKPGERMVCKCCGEVLPNEVALQVHLHSLHPAVYGRHDDRPRQVRGRLCGEVIENRDEERKRHLDVHPRDEVLRLSPPRLFDACVDGD